MRGRRANVRAITLPVQGDRLQQGVADAAGDATRKLRADPSLDAVYLDGIVLVAATPKEIRHSLSRRPKGWSIRDRTSAASVHRTAWSSTSITLQASADVTISLKLY